MRGGVFTEQARAAADEHGNNEQPHPDELKDRAHPLRERMRRRGCGRRVFSHVWGSLRIQEAIPIPDRFSTCGIDPDVRYKIADGTDPQPEFSETSPRPARGRE